MNSDEKILIRNRPKILDRVLKGHNFSKKEIDEINKNYDLQKDKFTNMIEYLRREESTTRERLLSDIYEATEIKNLKRVNDFMSLKIKNPDDELLKMLETLGLIER